MVSWLLLLLPTTGQSATVASTSKNPVDLPPSDDGCGLYLAPSRSQRIEETSWGIYAGVPYQTGDALGSPEVAIHLQGIKNTGNDKLAKYLQGLTWNAETAAAQFETSQKSVSFLPGIGIFAGCYMKKRNTRYNVTNAYHSHGRNGSPPENRGAESSFFNVQAVASNNIAVGSELFMGCGDDDDDEDEDVLSQKDYDRVDKAVGSMLQFFETHPTLNAESRKLIYDFFRQDVIKSAVNDEAKATKIDSLFPLRLESLQDIPKSGGAMQYHDPNPDLSWLEANGMCLDNIRVDDSEVSGRGAFATRFLPKTSTIAPVPLIHLPNRTVFDMLSDDETDHQQQQLMVNYCYAHPHSTYVFCPASSSVPAINHSPHPNAKLVWASPPPDETDLWKHKDHKERIFLMMRLVALDDIHPGTEVTIDYGAVWETAYKEHVKIWNEKEHTLPIRANDLNGILQLTEDLQIPEHIHVKMFLSRSQYNSLNGEPIVWSAEYAFKYKNLRDVKKVVSIDDAQNEYTIEIEGATAPATVISAVPREAIVFVDSPDVGDQFYRDSFRHPIGFPDDLFPAAWKNLDAGIAPSTR